MIDKFKSPRKLSPLSPLASLLSLPTRFISLNPYITNLIIPRGSPSKPYSSFTRLPALSPRILFCSSVSPALREKQNLCLVSIYTIGSRCEDPETQTIHSGRTEEIYYISEKGKMVCMVSRQGRELQRYNETGGRVVVGCIPYKLKEERPIGSRIDQSIEVLVISSQKGHGMMFPKGGWENDESIDQAVTREALEEAGIEGTLENKLGKWNYISKRYGTVYESIMYGLNVTKEHPQWPEMNSRKRRWVSVQEAREGCQTKWMREALEELLLSLNSFSLKEKVELAKL
ncbi:hypothetical protein LUZ60_000225 [Juncus effusus]|nr:hypothetical protein LUZ60_000225 [Juncus effusus]